MVDGFQFVPTEGGPYLTLAETAARRGVHERTVRRWVALGLPVVPVGGGEDRAGYLLFRQADVDSWEPPRKAGAPPGNQNARKNKKSGAAKPRKRRRKR